MRKPFIETDRKSRSEELIEQVKSRRPMQFGMLGLLMMTVLAAVAFATPRFLGLSYSSYFGLLGLLCYAGMPLLVMTAYLLMPAKWGSIRRPLAVGVVLPISLPWLIWVSYVAIEDFPAVFIAVLIAFWIPQTVCIAVIHYTLFR